jgi:2-methylisocitrate lyase-like PEP mutase family enzyme
VGRRNRARGRGGRLPAVATTSSGVTEALGYEDGDHTPVEEMLAAVARIERLAELGVARVSLGHFLHAEMLEALRTRVEGLRQPPR